MLLPLPHLLDAPLAPPSAETRACARRFVEASAVPLAALADLIAPAVAPSGFETKADCELTAKQVGYDRYFGVGRSELSPADTLARAALAAVRQVSLNAAEGHSLSPIEEHLIIAALREGLLMICADGEASGG
jgi:hypothetical protein